MDHQNRRGRRRVDDPYRRIPFLTGSALTGFVLEHGGQARIITSQGHSDLFFLSGVEPEQLRSGFNLRDTHLMIQAPDREWTAVKKVNVGYMGTGPRNATRALQSLGLDPDLVADIVGSNASDVRFAGGPDPIEPPVHPNVNPWVPLTAPELIGDTWVVRMDEVDLVSAGDLAADRNAVPPAHLTAGGGSHLDRWLDYLGRQPSEWCSGPRRARVYLSEAVAERDGFQQERSGMVVSSYQRPYTVIIEQGRAQLWIALRPSDEPGARFTPEIYDLLRLAGFYVDDLEARDNRAAFWRWLNRLGASTPEYVDLDDATPPGPLGVSTPSPSCPPGGGPDAGLDAPAPHRERDGDGCRRGARPLRIRCDLLLQCTDLHTYGQRGHFRGLAGCDRGAVSAARARAAPGPRVGVPPRRRPGPGMARRSPRPGVTLYQLLVESALDCVVSGCRLSVVEQVVVALLQAAVLVDPPVVAIVHSPRRVGDAGR